MIWDYTKTVQPLRPQHAHTRFRPVRALAAEKVTHLLWGYDAMISNGADYSIDRNHALQILVKSTDVESACTAITRHNKSFRASDKATFTADYPDSRYFYEPECCYLKSTSSNIFVSRYVIIIPEHIRHISIENFSNFKPLSGSKHFTLVREKYIGARVASFLALLNSMLSRLRLYDHSKPDGDDDSIAIYADAWTLFSWHIRQSLPVFDSIEDVPPEVVRVWESVHPDNREEFKNVFIYLRDSE